MRNRYEYQHNPYPYDTYSYPWLSSAEQSMWMPGEDDDREERRDLEYWTQLYPAQTRRIQREVGRQCDLLDYEGSVIYDEYPDRIALARICEAVYQSLMQEDAQNAMREFPAGMPARDMLSGRNGMWSGNESVMPDTEDGAMPENRMEDMSGIASEMDMGGEEENMADMGQADVSDYIAPEEEAEETFDFSGPSDLEMMQLGGNRHLQDLIEVLLYNEIHRRRCRRRRSRSWYFG